MPAIPSPGFVQLTSEVERSRGLAASVKTFIEGVAARIENAKNDPVQEQALADSLKASADVIERALLANPLPSDPVPNPDPVNPPVDPDPVDPVTGRRRVR